MNAKKRKSRTSSTFFKRGSNISNEGLTYFVTGYYSSPLMIFSLRSATFYPKIKIIGCDD